MRKECVVFQTCQSVCFFAITFSFCKTVTAIPGVVLLKDEKMMSSFFCNRRFEDDAEFALAGVDFDFCASVFIIVNKSKSSRDILYTIEFILLHFIKR
jgi:hypothetical protein